MGELLSLLRFNAGSGHIWLDEQRMLLLHARAFAELRKELLDSLGVERARGLLVRMGFASGQRDGELAVKERRAGLRTEDAFMLGPRLHSIEGIVSVEMIKLEMDLENKQFFGEFVWENSWECEAHVADFGYGDDPQCWSQIGYASGYTSAFMGRLVVFKEVECTSMGDSRCRIVGHVAEEWQDERYLDYFRQHHVAERLIEFNLGLEHLRALQPRREYDQKLVGVSPGFRAAFDLLRTAARSAITVLLLGETGVGKELFARWLHDNGPRAKQPFIAVNCAAIPAELIEAELFGVEKGAYTGAHHARAGRFERAHGGTLFLDEAGDLPPATQVKLLRVLQTGEIERLGADQATRVDVRIVAATNVDLPRAMQAGKFRSDLFYRLNTFPITIPPLRERTADIPALVGRFVEKYSTLYGKKLRGLTDKAMREVMKHAWPGNIRELENVIERAVLLAPDHGDIEAAYLWSSPSGAPVEGQLGAGGQITQSEGGTLDALCERVLEESIDIASLEQRLMQMAMQRAKGNLSQAARLLGITRPQLAYRLKKEGLPAS
ncbi:MULTISPECIES: sigma-54-dependent Fis family transcriptional regulator [Variovorax]|uniref:Sigma 54-interacting transcriptional regulator n=1 Tax=Variovorax ginsengisoli TaxID=363844 RepID=A0ABT8S8S0_9BURK|nr:MULTISPECIES: sigma-54-dependent Fis family transcriptional regulator [Variovorax]MDM0084314.1 sigma 54-interacting transcriptional regulator [Variovorax sp. J31P179]MDN8616008.1 sigma 54-interacting transcriptional regulator [Variovorax ginsengisoli]MDO1535178.1 sigma 54-interacting transcriptional regulator [Variovorax ginsengisoli]